MANQIKKIVSQIDRKVVTTVSIWILCYFSVPFGFATVQHFLAASQVGNEKTLNQ